MPAIKIGRLGRDKKYKGQNIGSLILHWAIGYIQTMSEHVGIRYITVDSYPDKIQWYKKNGFTQNQHKDYKDREHASMRFDLYNPPKK